MANIVKRFLGSFTCSMTKSEAAAREEVAKKMATEGIKGVSFTAHESVPDVLREEGSRFFPQRTWFLEKQKYPI